MKVFTNKNSYLERQDTSTVRKGTEFYEYKSDKKANSRLCPEIKI